MYALLSHLQTIVGADHVLTSGDLSPWEQDWRRRARGRALAVVLPANAQQVCAVVRACAAHGTTIVPQGGNTGLVMGSTPDSSGTQVVLSLRRMNAIRDIDTANLTMTVEAGCILHNVQAAAQAAGLLFPLSLAAEGSCTIGGNLATNAGGTQVVRYGNARDVCLGLEAVTAQGELWQGLTGLRKDNAGYDLRHLLIGSEGTLGIITAATLQLYPRPAACLSAWAAVPSLSAAVQLLGLAHQHLGDGLTGFEIMGQCALDLVRQHLPQLPMPWPPSAEPTTPWCVLVELSDHQSPEHACQRLDHWLETALAQHTITNAVVAHNLSQTAQLWHIRESIPLAQAQEGLNVKHDISIPISRIPAFVEHTDALLQRHWPGVRIVNFGHLGDGNLHYNVQAPAGHNAADFLKNHEAAINTQVYDAVAQFGGSFCAEHGVGSLKASALEHYQSPVALAMMRAIQQALDPQGTLNPGRVLAVQPRGVSPP